MLTSACWPSALVTENEATRMALGATCVQPAGEINVRVGVAEPLAAAGGEGIGVDAMSGWPGGNAISDGFVGVDGAIGCADCWSLGTL
jgi:hypothetical protein